MPLKTKGGNNYCLLPVGQEENWGEVNLSSFLHIQVYVVTEDMRIDPERVKKEERKKTSR